MGRKAIVDGIHVITCTEAGELLGIGRNAVTKIVARGDLRAFKIAGAYWIHMDSVLDYKNARRAKANIAQHPDDPTDVGGRARSRK